MSQRGRPEETAAPARNFTITTADRVRAMAAGPPAFARRRRRIEDLEVSIVAAIRAYEERYEVRVDAASLPAPIARAFRELERLVDVNNRFYPIEANLPIEPSTGELLDHGRPWEPMPAPSLGRLLLAAHARGEA